MPRYSMHMHLQTERSAFSIAVFLKGGPAGIEMREVTCRIGPVVVWRFRYAAFGLSQCQAKEFLKHPQPLAAALAALMNRGEWDPVTHKLECLRAVRRAENLGTSQRFVLVKIIDTYVELSAQEQARYAAEIERQENKEVREMVVTWEEALAEQRSEGLAEGRVEGRVEGRSEGKVEATREAILLWTRSRFRVLPADFEQKLLAIDDLERLHDILERIPESSSPEELGL